MTRIIISALLTGLLAACASTPSTPTAEPQAQKAAATAPSSAAASDGQTQKNKLPPYKDPQNVLSQKRSVFFDFDEFLVKNEFRPTVEAHAKYLGANQDQKIRIEGNADERGGREYNLALGQKRAEAVKKAMVVMGVKDAQIETVSWGKEKPRAAGHDEAAWAQNRRADIKYGDEK